MRVCKQGSTDMPLLTETHEMSDRLSTLEVASVFVGYSELIGGEAEQRRTNSAEHLGLPQLTILVTF